MQVARLCFAALVAGQHAFGQQVIRDDNFVLLSRHKNISVSTFSPDIHATGIENPGNPEANTYSIIGAVDPGDFLLSAGRYEFELIYEYSNHATDVLRWTQTSWLSEESAGDVDLSAITDSKAGTKAFAGLAKSSRYDTYLDGSPGDNTDFFHSVGVVLRLFGQIPAHEERLAISSELWVRYEDPLSGCDVAYADWLGDGFCDTGGDYNLGECGWDLGDCCETTCVDAAFLCGANGYDCKDPSIDPRVTPVGPLGGTGGGIFDDSAFYEGQRVVAINVRFGGSLDQIQVVYDAEPQPPAHGLPNANEATFAIPSGTHISEVCVSTVASGQYISAIQFFLSNGEESPIYGTQGNAFDCQIISKRLAYISGRAGFLVDQLTFWETAVLPSE